MYVRNAMTCIALLMGCTPSELSQPSPLAHSESPDQLVHIAIFDANPDSRRAASAYVGDILENAGITWIMQGSVVSGVFVAESDGRRAIAALKSGVKAWDFGGWIRINETR